MSLLALGASIYFAAQIFNQRYLQISTNILAKAVATLESSKDISANDKLALLNKLTESQKLPSNSQSDTDFSEEFWIFFSFLSFAFGGKFAQKIVEPKEPAEPTPEEPSAPTIVIETPPSENIGQLQGSSPYTTELNPIEEEEPDLINREGE
jgi:hypothetical protein